MAFSYSIEENILTVPVEISAIRGGNAIVNHDIFILAQEQSVKGVILDLAHVQFIDYTSIGELSVIAQRFKNLQIPFVICNPNEHISRLLQITNLKRIITIFPNRQQASEHILKTGNQFYPSSPF